MRALCIADAHLGASPQFGRAPAGPDSRLAKQTELLQQAVRVAVEHECDAMIVAGDLFHSRRASTREYRAAQAFLLDARWHALPVIVCRGNHDDEDALLALADADLIRLHTEPGITDIAGTPVGFLPWTSPARVVAERGGGDRDLVNRDVALMLTDIAGELRDQAAVLVGHWAVSGAWLPTGISTDELREPVIARADLDAQRWERMVFGHIHRASDVYLGTPYAIDWGDAEEAHTALSVGNASSGPCRIDDRRFLTLEYPTVEALGEHVAAGLSLDGAIVRVRYRCQQHEQVDHTDLARVLVDDCGAYVVTGIVADVQRAARARVDGLDTDHDPRALIDAWLSASDTPSELCEPVLDTATRYLA